MSTALRQWLLLIAGIFGFAGSLVMGELLLMRQAWRLDLTPSQRYVLSDHALRVLSHVKKDVRIIGFLRSRDPRNPNIEDLLRRVGRASKHVRYRVVDVNRSPALAREYGVDAYGSIVVESEGRRRDFTSPSEGVLIAAIVQVTEPGDRRVIFLTGHGERGMRASQDRGSFSSARAAVLAERYNVEEVHLLTDANLGADVAVLVIAGPRSDLLPRELLRLDGFLRKGGSLLVLLDPGNAPSLVAFLRRYGVVVGSQVVLDSENRLFAGDYLTMLVPGRAAGHPVSAEVRSPALMSVIRPVSFVPGPLAVAGIELLYTAPESWKTPDMGVLRAGAGTFVTGRDTRGPIPVGTSVVVRGSGARAGHLLVFGDADFASNALLGYLGNTDLFLNSINWLAGEKNLIGTRQPKQRLGRNQFFVSARQGKTAFWLGTVLEPVLMLVFGAVVFLRRRMTG